jgi:monothiol glutaredoxin
MMDQTLIAQIRREISAHRVVLFMKGTPEFPHCGFSAAVVAALDRVGTPFKAVNVLREPALRQALKEYSAWPTCPQLYVDGTFIGGSDIVREMYEAGELNMLLHGKPSEESLMQA